MSNRKIALVFASYKELETLPTLLKELSTYINSQHVIIVSDDSPEEIRIELVEKCIDALASKESKIDFSFGTSKAGRGAAILRGFKFASEKYGPFDFFIEADSDGSHTAFDINKLIMNKSEADLVIGSRYLPESKIIGWPISRKLFSKMLNSIIPYLLNIKCTDITNGLRRYSTRAVEAFYEEEPKNTGFVYLSEQALIVKNKKLTITEVPITFINRTIGESTVGLKEVLISLRGIFSLIKMEKE